MHDFVCRRFPYQEKHQPPNPKHPMIDKHDIRKRARREHRGSVSRLDRELMALDRERRRLWTIKCSAPLIELDEPYQRGWVRYFELNAQAKRRADATRLQEVVKMVECRQHCRTGKWRAWSLRRNRMVDMRHEPRKFSAAELLRKHPKEPLLKYFVTEHHGAQVNSYERLLFIRRSNYGGRLCFKYLHYLTQVVEPYMITHTRTHYPDVERRLDEIEAGLSRGGLERLDWLRGIRSWRRWRYEGPDFFERAAKRQMRDDIEDALAAPHELPPPQRETLPLKDFDQGADDRAFFVSGELILREAA